MGGGGNTELLGDIDVAALGTTSDIARAANQGFENMVAGLAMVFVDRHKEKSSHAGRLGVGQPQYYLQGMSKNTLAGLAAFDPPSWYSGPLKKACQCWLERVNSLHYETLSQP